MQVMAIMSTAFSLFSMGLYTPPASAQFLHLLEAGETTLEEVLGCEETLAQARKGCQPLLQLYSLPSFTQERLQALLALLLSEPPEDCSYDRGHKCPFVACELLGPAVPEVLEKLLACPAALSTLLTYLDLPVTNLTSAAYFATVVSALLCKAPKQVYELIYKDNHLPLALARNLHSRSLADCLLKLLTLDSAASGHYLPERTEVVKALVGNIGKGRELAETVHSAMLLCELVKGLEVKGWKLMVAAVVQQAELETLFEAIDAGEASGVAALQVLNALLSCESLCEICEINLPKVLSILRSLTPTPDSPIEDVDNALVPLLFTHLPSILHKLQGDFPAVGPLRLQICELMDLMLRQKSPAFEKVIIQAKGLQYATELFFKYPLNSILQLEFEGLVRTVVEKASVEVQKHVILEVELPLRLGNACENAKIANSGVFNMGFITRIAAFLKEKAGEMSFWPKNELWERYLEGYFAAETELESKSIGNPPEAWGTLHSDEEEDVDCEIHFTSLIDPNPVLIQAAPHTVPLPCSVYSSFLYWKVPVRTQELEELM